MVVGPLALSSILVAFVPCAGDRPLSKNVTKTLVNDEWLTQIGTAAGWNNLVMIRNILIESKGSYTVKEDGPYRVISKTGDEIKLGGNKSDKEPCRALEDLKSNWDQAGGFYLVIPSQEAATNLQKWNQDWTLNFLKTQECDTIATYELTPAYKISGTKTSPQLEVSDDVFMDALMIFGTVKINNAVKTLLYKCDLASQIINPEHDDYHNRGILNHIAYVITWKSFATDVNAKVREIHDVWEKNKADLQNGIIAGRFLDKVVKQMVSVYNTMSNRLFDVVDIRIVDAVIKVREQETGNTPPGSSALAVVPNFALLAAAVVSLLGTHA